MRVTLINPVDGTAMWDWGHFVRRIDVLQALFLWLAAYDSALLHSILAKKLCGRSDRRQDIWQDSHRTADKMYGLFNILFKYRGPLLDLLLFASSVSSSVCF